MRFVAAGLAGQFRLGEPGKVCQGRYGRQVTARIVQEGIVSVKTMVWQARHGPFCTVEPG